MSPGKFSAVAPLPAALALTKGGGFVSVRWRSLALVLDRTKGSSSEPAVEVTPIGWPSKRLISANHGRNKHFILRFYGFAWID